MVTTTPETQRWIAAAKILGLNPSAEVLCPRCEASFLEVQDVKAAPDVLERILRCRSCSAMNAMLMRGRDPR